MKRDRAEREEYDSQSLRREVGRWLREKRDEARLTQRELADAVGIEYYTFISQIEQGRGRIPPDRYAVYAKALKLNPRDFAITMLKYNEPHTYELIFGLAGVPVQEKADVEARLQRLEAALAKI